MPSSPEFRHISQKIWNKARSLEEPENYFEGYHGSAPILPERLLAFIRTSGLLLTQETYKGYHHRFVLVIALGSKGTLCVDERLIELGQGETLLLFPFQFHHFIALEKEVIQWLFITFELRTPYLLEGLRNHPQRATLEIMSLLDGFIQRLSISRPPTPEEAAEAQLQLGLILHRLLRDQTPWTPPKASSQTQQAASLLGAVNRFLVHHISRSFQLTELAKETGYSESHLRSLFRQHLGISLGQYIAEARIRKASGMLCQSNLTVTEVSERCGFSSIFSFSRSFRHATGHSPKEYQQLFGARAPKKRGA